MRKKRTKRSAEITVETDEIVVFKGSASPVSSYCPVCRREVSMIAPEQAARIAGVTVRKIYASVEGGNLHFVESSRGSLLICLDSLALATASPGKVAERPGS